MGNVPKALLILLPVLVYGSPTSILANQTDPSSSGTSDSDSEITVNDVVNSDQVESSKAESAKKSESGESKVPPIELVPAVIVIVQDLDGEPVKQATVEISPNKTGATTEKITNSKGIAKFKDLPASRFVVQVTAKGHTSHRQTINLGRSHDKITVVLKRRD